MTPEEISRSLRFKNMPENMQDEYTQKYLLDNTIQFLKKLEDEDE